jgi:hypothetical protein
VISTVWTDLVCSRAQYGPVCRRDRTGIDHATAALHWTIAVWSSPKIIFYYTSYSEAELLSHIKNLIRLTNIHSFKSISSSCSLRTPSSAALITSTCRSPACILSHDIIHSAVALPQGHQCAIDCAGLLTSACTGKIIFKLPLPINGMEKISSAMVDTAGKKRGDRFCSEISRS